jgi:crotonobetainyl-CoA:carnitine CoA-transferase CaiB-like acyl-CoA transferase
LAALEPHFWQRFCQAAGRKDLVRQQYSSSLRVRRKVAGFIASRTRAEWMEIFEREDIPAEPVLSAAEARAHPQARDRGLLSQGPDDLARLAFPAQFDGVRPRGGDRVPELGEQTAALLAELGLPERSRREWRREGVGRRFSWWRWLGWLR